MDEIQSISASCCIKAILILGISILSQSALLASPPPPGITLTSCDRSGAVIELQLPDYFTRPYNIGEETFTDLTVPGWDRLLEEGKPALPQVGILVALPPGARATLKIEAVEARTVPLSNPVPAPTWQTDGRGGNPVEPYFPDPSVYLSSSLYPQQWATLGEPTWLRTFWVVPLRITPFRSRTGRGEALVADKLRLRLAFHGGRRGRYIPDTHGEALPRSTIINFHQARNWQERGSGPQPKATQATGQYKLLVDNDGLYSITYSDLLSASIDPDLIDPQTIKINLEGQQIPIWVEGEWDGIFHASDYILFFGNFARGTYTYENIYTRTNVYWLDWGGDRGERLDTLSVSPGSAVPSTAYKASTRTEVDTLYEKFGFANLTEDIDHWMWLNLDDYFNPTSSYLLSLPGLSVSEGDTFDLTVSLRGYTFVDTIDPDHRIIVKWNDTTAIDATWDRQNALVVTGSVPWNCIRPEAPNELIFTAPEIPGVFSNSFYLDWIKVDYWRDYNVENDTLLFKKSENMGPNQFLYRLTGFQDTSNVELWNLADNKRLVNFEISHDTLSFQDFTSDTTYYYVAPSSRWLTPQIVEDEPSNWKSTSHGVDYLMITHEDFYVSIEPLATYYQSLGLRVERVKVGDIYDEFSYGLKNPQAIFDFIQYAYFNYQGDILSYILLVGDASWDYKDNDQHPYLDYVPTHALMTYKWGETASDNWFASVSGSEPLPDCYIGRLPVNNQEETELLVEKSLTYAQTPPPGYWRSQVIFTNGAYQENDATYFDESVQALIENYFPEWYDPPRIYSLPSPDYIQYQGDSTELMEALNLGAAMVNYVGHAGNQMWETLSMDNIGSLNNGDKLPFGAAFSCFTGIFSNTKGFGEAFILQPGGGGIAYWSNGTVGYMYPNSYINDLLFQELFSDTLNNPTFGQATTDAKCAYYALHGTGGMVVSTFSLMGDPGLTFIFEDPNPADTLDNSPPQISFSFPGFNFRDGDYVKNPVLFTCEIYDSTEIDLSTLTMELTRLKDGQGNFVGKTVLQFIWPDTLIPELDFNFYEPDSAGHKAEITFSDTLSDGEWQFQLSVADFFLQGPAVSTLNFNVAYGRLILEQPLNYPNPFRDYTSFTFTLSQDARTTIKVYTVSGKLIWTRTVSSHAGYNIYEWGGRDQQGDSISNGTYLYKIIARKGDQQVEKVERMIKIR